jgi:UDP-glucose 4-epimerase
MHVAVTGGAGFIGANLVRALLTEPDIETVSVLDDLSTGRRENLLGAEPTRFIQGSVCDPSDLDEAFDGVDAVVHLAARPSVPRSLADPLASHTANATGTLQVLEAARRAGGLHVVLASSSSVYGSNPQLPKREDAATKPLSPYAVSKLAGEHYGGVYAGCYGLPVTAFRFFNVYGPLQPADHAYAAVVPSFVSAALEGRPVQVFGDGRQTRDFTYVGSVVRVLCETVRRRVTHPGPINLAFGTRWSLLDVIKELEHLLGWPLDVEHSPGRAGDVRHSQADGQRLRRLFPDVEAVPLRDGLAATIEWFLIASGRRLSGVDSLDDGSGDGQLTPAARPGV